MPSAPPLRLVSDPPAPDAAPDLSLVIPAYNEEARLPATLARVAEYLQAQSYTWEVLVVDDGSRDQTARVAREWCARTPNARLVQYVDASNRAVNRGKGYAVRVGMLAARGRNRLFSDADLSTPIEEAEKLLPLLGSTCDIAIASRALPDSDLAIHQPPHREAMGRAFNVFVRAVIGTKISDTQCGFKAFRGEVAQHLFALARVDGFGFDTEIIFLAARKGYRVREVAVTWRHADDSRVSPLRAPIQMMRELFAVRLHARRGFYDEPRK